MEALNADNWLSIAAIVVSLIAMLYSHMTWRRSHAMESRMVQIEEERDRAASKEAARASISAQINQIGQYTYELCIINSGPGVARDLRLMLDGEPASECKSGRKVRDVVERLHPMATARFTFLPNLSNGLPDRISVEWSDDSGEPGHYESDL